MNILNELVQIEEPLLIKAGPGFGKTYTLAYKIKYLVENQKIKPDKLCVITFTNEAAVNMRKTINSEADERVYIKQELQPSVICTMHKLGDRIIRDNCSKIGLKRDFRVLSSRYLKDILIKDCAQMLKAKRQDAKDTISCRQEGKCVPTDSLKCEICSEYNKLLRRFNYIDHDDQIMLACRLLRENQYILRNERIKARYLLIDEYQDINCAQWELVKLLSGKTNNLFVVGDDYQSIYGFRGGHPKYIRNFQNDYGPNAIVKNLVDSRRCPSTIFKGAFTMVQKYNGGDIKFLDKVIFHNESEILIKVHNSKHQNLEADFIARKIKEIGPSYDSLILIPLLNYALPIKRSLQKYFVNFSCGYSIEETDLYLVSILLKWLKNPGDNFNFRFLIDEIINKGISDIPAKQTEFTGRKETKERREDALRQISNFWNEVGKNKTLYLKIKTLKDNNLFKKLITLMIELKKIYKENNSIDFIDLLVSRMKIWKDISFFSNDVNSVVEEIESLAKFQGECGVRIMTMKKAKGLEADYVFIVGLENNVLPRLKATDSEKEEDSRLLYVSMTRARKELYLLYSDIRDRNITKVQIDGRSEFIDAIPKECIELV